MNPQQLLEQLRPLHEPIEPSWWPLALGWWLCAALIVIISAAAYIMIRKIMRKTLVKRNARKLFKNITGDFERHQDISLLTRNISELCKRVLLAREQRAAVASLSQQKLIAVLEKNAKGKEIGPALRELLAGNIYQKNAMPDAIALIADTKTWINHL